MPAIINDYLLIWRFCVAYRNASTSGKTRYLGTIIQALFLALLTWVYCKVIQAPLPAKLATASSFCALLLATLAWCKFVHGAILANNPVCARVVPRIRRRALLCTLLAWIVLSALMALFIAIHQLLLASSPLGFGEFVQVTVLAFVAASALLLLAGIFASHHYGGWIASGTTLMVMSVSPWVTAHMAWEKLIYLPFTLLPVIGCAWFSFAFRNAGDAHWRVVNNVQLTPFFTPGASLFTMVTSTPTLFAKQTPAQANGLYARILQRDCQGAAAWSTMLLHGLGPDGHWSHWFRFVDWINAHRWKFALGAIVWLTLLWFNPPESHGTRRLPDLHGPLAVLGWILFWPMLSFQFARFTRLREQLANTTGEQALLRLAARPATQLDFNHQLARALFRSALREWCIATACAVLLGQAIGLNAVSLLYQVGLLSLGLPTICMLLINGADSTQAGKISIRNTFILHMAMLVYLIACIVVLPLPANNLTIQSSWLTGLSWPWLGLQLGWIVALVLLTWQIARYRLSTLTKMAAKPLLK